MNTSTASPTTTIQAGTASVALINVFSVGPEDQARLVERGSAGPTT